MLQKARQLWTSLLFSVHRFLVTRNSMSDGRKLNFLLHIKVDEAIDMLNCFISRSSDLCLNFFKFCIQLISCHSILLEEFDHFFHFFKSFLKHLVEMIYLLVQTINFSIQTFHDRTQLLNRRNDCR